MNKGKLQEAIALAGETGRVFVGTADGSGLPHIAAAGEMGMIDGSGSTVSVSSWFCPGTIANLQANPWVSLVVWNQEQDVGYQLIGRAVKTEDIAMMDGYVGDREEKTPLPQEERRIIVEVEKILHFSVGPHSDVEE